ncbi:MAG: acetyltransferase [SAR86 cluster bacterium]|jgi:1-acyl-sn-glycerol-3-phosphate acyltransferase|nr:acetyltransferase [SAR86 cluster bacterium]
MSFIIGVSSFLLIVLNTLFWCFFLLSFAILKIFFPIEAWKVLCTKYIILIGECWIACNGIWIRYLHNPKWIVSGFESLNRDNWYLATANHQSWADIFILQGITNKKIPMLKFFMKDILFWVPVIGLAWWALDMPFLKRYSEEQLKKNPELRGKDISQMQSSFSRFARYPVSIFSFAEGTRYSESKHFIQESPFLNLLRPKLGGIGLALSTMPYINQFVDFTISYEAKKRTFWAFLSGKMSEVNIHVNIIDIPSILKGRDYLNDSTYRENLKVWMNDIWKEKEKFLK